ncbi:VIR protein [Plasmodium vivax]|uniref:VIR protein n=1 Tax=Plasmodium vivax TaxID=5855 RepID=A0A1G4GSC6_PLAVI|nr:VIR protein [Plasmodium vivax]
MVDSKLKKTYPFLKRIWEKYGYDEDVVENNNNASIISLCNNDTIYGNSPNDDQKKACKKLLKNFVLLHTDIKTSGVHDEWCKNLNNWIYYEISPHNLTDVIVHKILNEAQLKLIKLPHQLYCSYNSVKENDNLEKLIELRIFNNNFMTFLSIVKDESDQDYCSCQKFLEDCVNVYIDMKQRYCSEQRTRTNSREICREITEFPFLYAYFTQESKIVKKIPKIDTGKREEVLIKCPSTVKSLEVQPTLATGSDTTTPKRDSTVPTALGTVAGASSVLALLYRFTPAGRFLNSGLRKSGGRINSGLHEGYPSELGFDGMEHNLINSYNIGYEAA